MGTFINKKVVLIQQPNTSHWYVTSRSKIHLHLLLFGVFSLKSSSHRLSVSCLVQALCNIYLDFCLLLKWQILIVIQHNSACAADIYIYQRLALKLICDEMIVTQLYILYRNTLALQAALVCHREDFAPLFWLKRHFHFSTWCLNSAAGGSVQQKLLF